MADSKVNLTPPSMQTSVNSSSNSNNYELYNESNTNNSPHDNKYSNSIPESTQFYLSETTTERDVRIQELFNTLDRDQQGILDSNAIKQGFTAMTHLPAGNKYANELMARCDTSHDGLIDYEEFKAYVTDKEHELWSLFKSLDRSGDGQLNSTDVQIALSKAGMEICQEDVMDFMQLMDIDGNGLIDFHEFKNFLLLLPRTNMCDMYKYYESETKLTQDGEVVIPTNVETGRSTLGYLLAGGMAGAISRTCTAPFDRLKVCLITHSHTAGESPLTIVSAVKFIYEKGGWKSFFVGNGLNIMKIIPESAIKFYSYESCKQLFANILHCEDKDSIPTTARFAAGGVAGICSQFSIYPVETLKTRIMTQEARYSNSGTVPSSSTRRAGNGMISALAYNFSTSSRSSSSPSGTSANNGINNQQKATTKSSIIRETTKNMYAKGGVRAFWPGLTLGLIGVFPYQAMDLGIYETLKLSYLKHYSSQQGSSNDGIQNQPNVFVLWACGMVSGTVGATSVYPLNVIRTRLQAQGTQGHPRIYKTPWEAVQVTFESEGIKGFYKGLGPTLLKVVPAVSLSYVTYEWSKKQFGLS